MARLEILECVNDPASVGKTGDDRYGFDEQGGRVWVLDGATDVSALKPFKRFESGASWYAETFSSWLLMNPPSGEMDTAYWHTALTAMRNAADAATSLPIDALPKEAWPIAAGVSLQLLNDKAVFNWLGDSLAIVDQGDGAVQTFGMEEDVDAETEVARTLLAMSEADRMAGLRSERASQNTNEYWVYGLDPVAAAHVQSASVAATAGTEIVMMTDGLYRLIDPYRTHSGADMFAVARADGLNGLIHSLRAYEATSEGGVRIKARDDACAVWLRLSD